jgi:hypothetical protein
MPDPTPPLASSCFPWPLSIAAYHLLIFFCRMWPTEQSRRIAVDNLVPQVLRAANPRTGSACASSRTYEQYATRSNLLLSVTPTADSSVTNPLRNQPCSTSSLCRCLPPSGHSAASPPRLHTPLTGAPFRSTTVYTSALPQSQSSTRFPSHLLIAYHPLHPSSRQERSSSPFFLKVLLLCCLPSFRSDIVVTSFLSCKISFISAGRALCFSFVLLSIHLL